jgi:catechol 2,3-dioxygenase-like lactoylglutathione lyase family enzyme
MLDQDDVVAFVATAKPPEALRFYRDVLGLRLIEDTPFAQVFDANGVMLLVTPVPDHKPVGHTVLGWKVADIEARVAALDARGVFFARFPSLTQDARGIWTTPDGNKVAWFKDPDGNLLSLTQFVS